MDRPESTGCRTVGSPVSVRNLSACPLLAFVGRWLGRSLAAWPEVVDRLEFGRRRTADPSLSVGEDAGPLIRAFLLATSSACPLSGSEDSWVSRVEALNRLDPCVDFVSNRRLSS